MDYLTNKEITHMDARKLAFFIVMTAACIALQIAPRPPNVEFTSFFSFIVGLAEGAVVGACFGSFIMLINGFVSPYGFGGLNIPFQMAGMIIAGGLGGAYRKFTPNMNFSARFSLETALLGAVIALVYDLITNLGYGLQLVLTGESLSLAFFTAIAIGAFYSLLHIISNTVVFGVLFLPVINALNGSKAGG
jgi:hypothetical protein